MDHTHTVLDDIRDQVLHVFGRFSNPQYTNACVFIQKKTSPKAVLQMRFFAHLTWPNTCKKSTCKHVELALQNQLTRNGPYKTLGTVDQTILSLYREQLQTSFNILQHLASAWLSCTDRVPCDGQRCSPTPSSMSLSCPPPRNQLEPSGGAPRHLHQQWKPYQDVNCINNYKSMTSFY